MQTASSIAIRGPASRRDARSLLVLAAPVVLGMLVVKAPFASRIAAGALAMTTFLVLALNARDLALSGVLTWLIFLGFTRRALIPFIGYPKFDPLLLVGPACALVLWFTQRDERVPRTVMSSLAALLCLLVIAQTLNPLAQTGASLLGLLFWLGPFVWLAVGRTLREAEIDRIHRLLLILIVPVTALGLYHSFGKLLPFELHWVGVSGLGQAVFMQNFKIRPFSTLVSPQEYGEILLFALTIIWCRLLTTPEARGWRILLFVVVSFALFLQASRNLFALFAVMMIVTALVRVRVRGARLLAAASLGLMLLLAASHAARPGQEAPKVLPASTSTAQTLIQHQIAGFTNPQSSTLPVHIAMVVDGFETAWDNPFGLGASEASVAQGKLGTKARSTENDYANVFMALGLPGGLLYSAFMVAVFLAAAVRLRHRITPVSLTALGLLIAYLAQWWVGQLYAPAAFFWLTLGWLSRPVEEDVDAAS